MQCVESQRLAEDLTIDASSFVATAREAGVLSPESAQRLADEATVLEISAEHLALRKGLLSAVQVDLVQTLQKPLDTIPGYAIQGVLGHGGMGVVYRATQTNLQRAVALKTVLLSLVTDTKAVARFQQEAVTIASLRHPNIITAFDFGQHAGRFFLVMELIEGEDVSELVRRNGPLDEKSAWGLARQVAAGLAHAAQEGIVHRDIKPANLLLVTPPAGFGLPGGLKMVKIADFGLAFPGGQEDAKTRLTDANTTLGSPHYMAPEQLVNSQVDHRADIYALGVTVFHMLTGAPPFSGPVTQVLAQKLQGQMPDVRVQRPDVSLASADLIARMTRTEPTARPGDYGELLDCIDRVLQETSGAPQASRTNHASSVSASQQQSSGVDFDPTETILIGNVQSRRRAWLITAPVAGVILIGGLLLAKRRQGRNPSPRARPVSTGRREYLFQGTLTDWRVISGEWGDASDTDGAKVLAGSRGTARRQLSRMAGAERQPLEHYRLALSICLHKASAVELQFGIIASKELDGLRSVCRINRSGQVWLTSRETDSSILPSPVTENSWEISPDTYYPVILECFDNVWRVTFDGQIVGELPSADHPHRSEIRLAVENGPAWFSDLELEELALQRK